MNLPASLETDAVHERAIAIARGLDGIRAADALAILDNAKRYLLMASVSQTALIPIKNAALQIEP
jgi:hypothetical protein